MIPRIDPVQGAAASRAASPAARTSTGGEAFAKVLQREIQDAAPVRFSAHAQQRLDSRHVSLTHSDRQRLNDAVDELARKGSRESLVLMDRMAMVVNVPNRTVITVVPQAEAAASVFTNIDSAVVVPTVGAAG